MEDKREDSSIVNAAEDNRENLSKERVNDVEEGKREDSSTERVPSQPVNIVNDVEEDRREDSSAERVPSQPVDIVKDVEEDKQEDSSTERVPSQPVDIVKDVEEDRREDSNKIRVNVPEEVHREDSSNDKVEPIEEDKPKNLGTSSVPFEAKPLEINFPQLKKLSSELHEDLVEMRDNVVHRKYPRGGRYFDDPTSKSVMADEFLSLNKKKGMKKCLLCGDRNHKAKNCKQVVDCFVCYSRGHLESDCPKKQIDKDENGTLCLKCGDVGHDMFSCSNTYFPDDLEKIQCSVCMAFGHLSCVDYMVEDRKQVSCYKCGELGHPGSDCKKLLESFSTTTTRLFCYRCRQRGHYSRECAKRNKAPDVDSASESIIPNLALIQSNSILPRSNLQPCNSFSLEERVGETSAQ